MRNKETAEKNSFFRKSHQCPKCQIIDNDIQVTDAEQSVFRHIWEMEKVIAIKL